MADYYQQRQQWTFRQLRQSRRSDVTKRVRIRLKIKVPQQATKGILIALRGARQRLNLVVARKIAEITKANFGYFGPMRPIPWKPYARDYPKWGKKKGGAATLTREWILYNSVRYSATAQGGMVSAEGSRNYAAAQQFGYKPNNLPPRPYFPFIRAFGDIKLIAPAKAEVERVLTDEVLKIFKS